MSILTLAPIPVAESITAAQVLEGLQRRYKESRNPDARRRYVRCLWSTPVDVSIVEGDGHVSATDETTTYDFSPGGVGFVWYKALEAGTVVNVCFKSLPQQPKLTATVRHSTPIKTHYIRGGPYHIGAEFPDDVADPRPMFHQPAPR